MAIGPHDEQACLRLVHVLQEHLSGRCRGDEGMRLGYHVVPLQEGYSALDAEVCLLLMRIDTYDMHFVSLVQFYSLEHL